MKRQRKPKGEQRERGEEMEADLWQYKVIESYGIGCNWLGKGQAMWAIGLLKKGTEPIAVATTVNIKGWWYVPPSEKQVNFLNYKRLPASRARNKREAGLLLDAALAPVKLYKKLTRMIDKAASEEELTAIGRDVGLVRGVLSEECFAPLVEIGKQRREELKGMALL